MISQLVVALVIIALLYQRAFPWAALFNTISFVNADKQKISSAMSIREFNNIAKEVRGIKETLFFYYDNEAITAWEIQHKVNEIFIPSI